ncbi:MAG: four helix bundle protein [Bacteroidales bacterium]|jgi:four helix bundle protein
MRKEMEDRLIGFAVMLYDVCENIDKSFIGTNLVNQLIRSGTSAALNYAEAQSAESRKDFIHKTSIVLKELRESGYNLAIIQKSGICGDLEKIQKAIDETQELISIFYRSVETARKNAKSEK